ncbi:tryptophan 2,3-dioxygenase family protein [Dinghuibacter silviterrae]|uniref:Tryptophan 2,3-dioxygenase n=1 Tax=Dinghuibacter silviterrae TaxID=1539049 RepID=A0A4R8DS47_9BACT|nr:tryptophan 2,3-dioxygenase family protein [Dinghuibacter silviterrae]TDX01064.1 tryptophan 2,3-dioxygenase [Dinghuibacter silviterrae]
MQHPSLYYHDYLELDKVLDSQHPRSFAPGQQPAHDEMLFIIIHQAYELWFKQIQFELDFVQDVFGQTHINDNDEDLNLVRHRLHRIIRILELLNQQITLLDTMTPLDFLEFRNLLTPSSGFQSLQFRLIEARLGLRMEERHQRDYYKRTNEGGFSTAHYQTLHQTESGESLLHQVNRWLERMPFFKMEYWGSYGATEGSGHPFWNDYATLYRQSLTEKEAGKWEDFKAFFFPTGAHSTSLSPEALRSALFIMLFRDFPVFQTSYQVLDALIEIDHWMAGWRHKHLTMVRRMIGMRVGTGNTTGAGYLEGALTGHYVYRDLAALSTYLIERRKLPHLPIELIRHLSFNT